MVGALAAALDTDSVDASLEAACVKVFASELVWRSSDELVQLAGGRGFVKPWPYERYLRDARINRIFEGANEILRLFVGLNGIQGPAEELKEIAGAMKSPMKNWVLVSSFAADKVASAFGKRDRFEVALHPALRSQADFVERHVAELAKATQQAITTHRKEILQRQLVVERLADMAIELYARATTIARTQKLITERGVDACAREIALTELFCLQSGRRFRALRMELDGDAGDRIDELRLSVAQRVRAEQGYASSDAVLDVAVPPLPQWSLTRDEQARAVGLTD
jgi:acyl-CoA dehydrogenase family protein 9